MNLLVDELPRTVKIGDGVYEINTDFRISILFELLMQDDDIPDNEKAIQALRLYFPFLPDENFGDIVQAIIWFYRCGRSDKERRLSSSADGASDGPEPSQRAYSFDYDDDYIYAAFFQQYGINLTTVEMHWWEFRALFKGLDHNCEFVKIMGYRTAKIKKNMSKAEKAFLRRMKSIHALPVSNKERKETDILMNALMNGGDLTGILSKESGGIE